MVLFTGSTVEEAIQNGLNELEIPRMKAHIKVISREKKGFLGLFGKKPAQVDIESISETTVNNTITRFLLTFSFSVLFSKLFFS